MKTPFRETFFWAFYGNVENISEKRQRPWTRRVFETRRQVEPKDDKQKGGKKEEGKRHFSETGEVERNKKGIGDFGRLKRGEMTESGTERRPESESHLSLMSAETRSRIDAHVTVTCHKGSHQLQWSPGCSAGSS